jgi:hypothetical protein
MITECRDAEERHWRSRDPGTGITEGKLAPVSQVLAAEVVSAPGVADVASGGLAQAIRHRPRQSDARAVHKREVEPALGLGRA